MLELYIDRAANVIVINGRTQRGRRRWEANVLAALIQGEHQSALTAASTQQLDALLQPLGQAAPLTRKQWSLLWTSIGEMFGQACASEALQARLHHPPRGSTVGPWWWTPLAGDRTEVAGQPATVAEIPLAKLAADGTSTTSLRLCRQFLVAQGLQTEGQLEMAAEALQEAPAWAGASPEANALRLLRLGEVELLRRRFDAARLAAEDAMTIAADQEVTQAYLGSHLSLLQHRIAYAEHPVTGAITIRSAIAHGLRRPPCARHLEVDPLSRGLALNLAALCERRWIERQTGQLSPGELARHADVAQGYWFGALFGFLVSNQHEHVHNMCSNLGYLFQRLTELDLWPVAEAALEWYALAQAWHHRFDLPDSTVWEYVFLGDFWLARPEVRALMSGKRWQGLWAGQHPSHLGFYSYAMQRAEEIGEPRQQAHCALNLWRFCRHKRLGPPTAEAQRRLNQLLQDHPDLRTIMESEGYTLPDESPASRARQQHPAVLMPPGVASMSAELRS